MPTDIIPVAGPYQEIAAEATYQIENLLNALMVGADKLHEEDGDLGDMKRLVDAICIRVKDLNGSVMAIVTGDGMPDDALSVRPDMARELGIERSQTEMAMADFDVRR